MAVQKKTLAIDFDGCIHSYASGFKGVAEIPDPPVPGAFDFIERALTVFDRVCVFSTRNESHRGRVAMVDWFRQYGMKEEVLTKLLFPQSKPKAFVYIDDRAVTFRGNWDEVDPVELATFKPWWK